MYRSIALHQFLIVALCYADTIRFCVSGPHAVLKIADFTGVQEVIDPVAPPARTAVNVLFSAPEILEGARCNAAADMWSIGVMLYMLAFGYAPFSDSPFGPITGDIDALIVKVWDHFVNRNLTLASLLSV